MRKLMVRKIWASAFLLTVFAVGCSDPDKNAGTGSPGAPLTPPTVASVTPLNASIAVCPNTGIITATFSKAMNPNTLNATTFTLTGGISATTPSLRLIRSQTSQISKRWTLWPLATGSLT